MTEQPHTRSDILNLLLKVTMQIRDYQTPPRAMRDDWIACLQAAIRYLTAASHTTEGDHLHMESGVSYRTSAPFVRLSWGEMVGQLTPDEIRTHALGLLESASAAEHDSYLLRWLLDNGIVDSIQKAAPLLVAFRAYREAPEGASLQRQDTMPPAEDAP